MRTTYDLEMLREVGFCSGIENYFATPRRPGGGERAPTRSSTTSPTTTSWCSTSRIAHCAAPRDVRGRRVPEDHAGRVRVPAPSAIDNRPLRFEEFQERVDQIVYMSATPGPWEPKVSTHRGAYRPADRADRPRGRDPTHEGTGRRPDRGDPTPGRGRPAGARDHAHQEDGRRPHRLPDRDGSGSGISTRRWTRSSGSRSSGTSGWGVRRPGGDQPAPRGARPARGLLVAILDADKEGFLRSETSLIQTIGRAARNVDGTVLMYADDVTDSMKTAISETQRRRMIQEAYNQEHASIRRPCDGGSTTSCSRSRRTRPSARRRPEGAAEACTRARRCRRKSWSGCCWSSRRRCTRRRSRPPVRVRGAPARRGRGPAEGAQGAPRRRGRRVSRLQHPGVGRVAGPGSLRRGRPDRQRARGCRRGPRRPSRPPTTRSAWTAS